jgi:hypothetical protein
MRPSGSIWHAQHRIETGCPLFEEIHMSCVVPADQGAEAELLVVSCVVLAEPTHGNFLQPCLREALARSKFLSVRMKPAVWGKCSLLADNTQAPASDENSLIEEFLRNRRFGRTEP